MKAKVGGFSPDMFAVCGHLSGLKSPTYKNTKCKNP
jgi:hypothetical protein